MNCWARRASVGSEGRGNVAGLKANHEGQPQLSPVTGTVEIAAGEFLDPVEVTTHRVPDAPSRRFESPRKAVEAWTLELEAMRDHG